MPAPAKGIPQVSKNAETGKPEGGTPTSASGNQSEKWNVASLIIGVILLLGGGLIVLNSLHHFGGFFPHVIGLRGPWFFGGLRAVFMLCVAIVFVIVGLKLALGSHKKG